MFVGRSEELGLLEKLYAKNSLNVVLYERMNIKSVKLLCLQEFYKKNLLLILLPAMRCQL